MYIILGKKLSSYNEGGKVIQRFTESQSFNPQRCLQTHCHQRGSITASNISSSVLCGLKVTGASSQLCSEQAFPTESRMQNLYRPDFNGERVHQENHCLSLNIILVVVVEQRLLDNDCNNNTHLPMPSDLAGLSEVRAE